MKKLTGLCAPPKGCAARNGGKCKGRTEPATLGGDVALGAVLIKCECANARPRRELPEGWQHIEPGKPDQRGGNPHGPGDDSDPKCPHGLEPDDWFFCLGNCPVHDWPQERGA
jgi:hypothetical protein